jgi:hypothetical protein
MYGRLGTPVLFLVFNRPETTRKVFDAIRQARTPRLYLAADGPRDNRPGEHENCELVRKIVTAVDWPCEVRTYFREKNLGCGIAVGTAIDWFFAHESEGVILEDDCLPDPSFFRFCEELLERYRHNHRVMMISGECYPIGQNQQNHSYLFSRYIGTWGWATWARAWRNNDRTMSRWPEVRASDWLMRVGDGHKDFARYWTEAFDAVYAGRNDIWDYQWAYSCWLWEGITILPSKNLIKYIGFDSNATHTVGDGGWMSRLPSEAMPFPLLHPEKLERDRVADRWIDVNVFGVQMKDYKNILCKIPGFRWGVAQLRTFWSLQ